MTRPNIVLIVMDTARSVDVSLGDEGPDTMPSLRTLATEGTAFTNATANAPWTLPSHGTLFSGRHPSVHGAHADHKQFDSAPTLAQKLKRVGYHTAAVSNNTWISGEFGFERGFEEFVSTWQLFQDGVDFGDIAQTETGIKDQIRSIFRKFRGNPLKNVVNLVYGNFFRKRNDDGAKRTNRIVADQLPKWRERSEPFFLFLNYLEPHLEYDPPEKYAKGYLPDGVSLSTARSVNQDAWAYITGEQSMDKRDFEILRGLYRAELTYLDDRISELLVQFEEAGVREDTVFIITGDHGENIGDHGLMDHQYSLHETLLHVPLVIEGPGFDSEENVERPTQLLDIFPTVLDLADADFDREEYVGRSLCDIESLSENRPRLTEYVAPQPAIRTLAERYDCSRSVERYDRRLWALKHGDEKYVRGSDGTEWLYDLGEDPNEQTELSDQRPERCQTLSDDLDAYLEELPDATEYTSDVSMDAATEQRLEDLGYLQ